MRQSQQNTDGELNPKEQMVKHSDTQPMWKSSVRYANTKNIKEICFLSHYIENVLCAAHS